MTDFIATVALYKDHDKAIITKEVTANTGDLAAIAAYTASATDQTNGGHFARAVVGIIPKEPPLAPAGPAYVEPEL